MNKAVVSGQWSVVSKGSQGEHFFSPWAFRSLDFRFWLQAFAVRPIEAGAGWRKLLSLCLRLGH
jgi:hypothetical protein